MATGSAVSSLPPNSCTLRRPADRQRLPPQHRHRGLEDGDAPGRRRVSLTPGRQTFRKTNLGHRCVHLYVVSGVHLVTTVHQADPGVVAVGTQPGWHRHVRRGTDDAALPVPHWRKALWSMASLFPVFRPGVAALSVSGGPVRASRDSVAGPAGTRHPESRASRRGRQRARRRRMPPRHPAGPAVRRLGG